MGGDRKPTKKEAIGNLLTGSAVQLGKGSEEITKKLGTETGVYTSSAMKKEQATEQQAQEQAAITAKTEEQAKKDAEVRQRMNIFKTSGGSQGEEIYSTGKKRKLFSN